MAKIRDRSVPRLRGLDPDLRAKRLRAARKFAVGSVPRLAIMLGHWDSGEFVRLGGEIAPRPKRRRRKHG